MTYIYDHSKGTIISDEKPEQLKDKKTRKPGALPPGTKTIKYNTGGPVKQTPREENLNERLERLLYEYVREILNKSYKSNPDLLTDQELKMIGKYKSKNKVELPEIPKPIINIPEPTPPPKPTKPLSQIIKEGADERLKEEQRIYDERFGKGGITKLFRPE